MANGNSKKTPAVQSTRQQLDELDALLQKMLALPVAPSEAEAEEEVAETPAQPPVLPSAPVENPLLPRRVSLRPIPQPAETPAEVEQPTTTGPAFGPRLVQPDQAVPVREIPQPEEDLPQDWVPLRGHWQPSAQTWGPLAEIFKQQQQGQQPGSDQDEDPEAVRDTVRIPIPGMNGTYPLQPTLPVPLPGMLPLPETCPPVEEQPVSSAEAMARLELARRASAPPNPVPTPPPPPPAPLSTELLPKAQKPASPAGRVNLVLFPLVALNTVYDVGTYPLGPIGRWLRDGGRGALAMLGGVFLVATTAILALDWFEWTW
jgi:hypothetical protein